jgi:hypothetical protein
MDTRGELGRYSAFASMGPRNNGLVVGAEPSFPGLSQIKANLDGDFNYRRGGFVIHETLYETLDAAKAAMGYTIRHIF